MLQAGSSRIAPILIVILAGSLAGCYTLMKHPTVSEAPDEGDFSRCSDCHDASYNVCPYRPYYPQTWMLYYEIPWWYDQIIISGDDRSAPVERRGIIDKEPVKRAIDGGGIGTTISPGGGSSGGDVKTPIGPTGSSGKDGTVIKKESGGDASGAKRDIKDATPVKREGDASRTNESKDVKKEQSSDAKDESKGSGETKDSKEKKKE